MAQSKKDPERLERLAQKMFNRERTLIETEIELRLKQFLEEQSARNAFYSGATLSRALRLHVERLERFAHERLKISRRIFLSGKEVSSDEEISLIMGYIDKMMEPQQKVILSSIMPVINRSSKKEDFLERLATEANRLRSNIKRDLIIEKEQSLLLERIEGSPEPIRVGTSASFKKYVERIEDDRLRGIVLRDLQHADFCLRNDAWKPCVILCGGIIEGVLQAEFSIGGKPEEIIKEAATRGIISTKFEEPLAQAVRQFRNYAHIERELKDGRELSEQDAGIALNVTKNVLNQINAYKKSQSNLSK